MLIYSIQFFMKTIINNPPRVGVVGPCTAGKTTLIRNLAGRYPIELRHKAQEHSYVQSMWQRINPPDWLVFLDVSYNVSLQRKNLDWTPAEYQEQQRRLAHAREHADYYLMTDNLTAAQVAEKVAEFFDSLALPLEQESS
jgi:ATPase subunit of ABC transporter with duplicated ATPase domains